MILKLTYYGDPTLRKKAAPVTEFSAELEQLIRDMTDTMIDKRGVGIAAPQVGRSLALFITQFPVDADKEEWEPEPIEVFINPKILEVNDIESVHSEGCLSIPGIYEDVIRPTRIKIRAQNTKGEFFERIYEGYRARVCMHENDHINGVLFIDRLSPKQKKELEPELRKIKKQYSPDSRSKA